MKTAILYLFFSLPVVSCGPHQSISKPIVHQPEESHDIFAGLLKRKASRIDVEVLACLGEHYDTASNLDGHKLSKAVIRSLTQSGMSKDSPYGNTIYRVTRVAQARTILAGTWPEIDFGDHSELASYFRRYPHASIAIMECDNQRIFFFDENERLVAIYPVEGPNSQQT